MNCEPCVGKVIRGRESGESTRVDLLVILLTVTKCIRKKKSSQLNQFYISI